MDLETLESIFQRQKELAERFHRIETSNLGLTHSIPIDLDSFHGQAVMRLFVTYFVEEMWEFNKAETADSQREELADALHFLVELMLMGGVTPLALNTMPVLRLPEYVSGSSVGILLHALRNRPWKLYVGQANLGNIRYALCMVYREFLNLVEEAGVEEKDLIDAYFDKVKVNHTRINSGN